MRTERFDAIVIGAGAAGSAAAWQLSKDGRRALLLEQFKIGHTRGSSHGESRIFRFAYPQASYAKFAMQSKPLWLDLERVSDKKLLHTTGGLDFADDPDCFGEVRQIAGALKQNGARYEELSAQEIRNRFPQFRVPEQTIGCYSPDGGWIAASEAVQAMVDQVVALGGSVRDEEPVKTIRVTNHDVEIATAKSTYAADLLVIAAGAWTKPLLMGDKVLGFHHEGPGRDEVEKRSCGFLDQFAALELKVTQEQPVYFAPIRNAEELRRAPIWIHYRKPFFTYGFPLLGKGFKAAFHHNGPVIDPTRADRAPDPITSRKLRDYLATYIPDAAGEILEEVTCLYTTTADHNFIIDTIPGFPNVALASPCSGHGFKFAAGTGRALADLVQFGKTSLEIAHTRFFNTAGPSRSNS
jgi:sarcosine oxidase